MEPKIVLSQELLMQTDFRNTINGGFVEPFLYQKKLSNGYYVSVRIPGIKMENLKLKVMDHKLTIYHLISIFKQGSKDADNYKSVHSICVVQIPHDVDQLKITAKYDYQEDELVIILPFLGHEHQQERPLSFEK
jgi:HSP20 family molecular chaperone IbpA